MGKKKFSPPKIRVSCDAPLSAALAAVCVAVAAIDAFALKRKISQSLLGAAPFDWKNGLCYLKAIALSFVHPRAPSLLANCVVIVMAGGALEKRRGSAAMAAVSLAAMFATGIALALFAPRALPGLGGVAFMALFLSLFDSIACGELPLPQVLALALFAASVFLESLAAQAGFAAAAAHLAGGLCASLAALFIPKKKSAASERSAPTERRGSDETVVGTISFDDD